MFGAEFVVLLYDLTSSYAEGRAEKNPMMQYGYSRDHRSDTKQEVIALIVYRESFPLSCETFNGNRTDVAAVEAVMRMVERKYGRARRVWVFNRGIVSEESLAAARKRGEYLVGTRRAKLKPVECELLEGGWTQLREQVEAKLISTPTGTETYVLCRSRPRREKEHAIHHRSSARLERALEHLAQQVKQGQLKDRSKIERRLGRIQARSSHVADVYRMNLTEGDGPLVFDSDLIEGCRAWREGREGAYWLRTNLEGEIAEELWTTYFQLTEAALRVLKSEPSIRPLLPQIEPGVKGHIMVAFLGYALWVTLKHRRVRTPSGLSPARALELLSTLESADIRTAHHHGREIRLRRITETSLEQEQLLHQLWITLAQPLKIDPGCGESLPIP